MKRLVVTADDFGLSPGVVEGILEAHQRGIVTATSLMINAPATDEAFRIARAHPTFSTGLHFVLTFGEPVGPREPLGDLLGDDGAFRRHDSGAHARATPGQVRAELRAQLHRFEAGAGRPPTHIDGHHHVHTHPGILRVVIEEAGRLGIAVRATGPRMRERLALERIATEDHFVENFYGAGATGEGALKKILGTLQDGTSELMCHPAKQDPRLASLSSYVVPRYEELRTLTSPGVTRALGELGVELAGR